MADSHYEVDIFLDGKFTPVTGDDGETPVKFSTGELSKKLAKSIADGDGVPAKVVLVKTIRSVIVAYKPKAVRNG